jgi:hypothetical protein
MNSYPYLISSDLYSLRCGIVHQGKSGNHKMTYSRIVFTLPVPNRVILHNNIINDALNLDAEIFCRDMINSVLRWYDQNQGTIYVKANLPCVVRLYPNGLPPYIVGIPVIS